MPGGAAGQTRCLGAGRVAENASPIPAKCERRPQWVCFSLRARSYFTACEGEGNRSHPSVHAAMSIPSAGIWLLGRMAFPGTPCCSHWTPLSPFPPGSFSQLIQFQAVEEPCSPLAPPPPQPGGALEQGHPPADSTQSRQPLSAPNPAPLSSSKEGSGEESGKGQQGEGVRQELGCGAINPSIAGAFSQKPSLV